MAKFLCGFMVCLLVLTFVPAGFSQSSTGTILGVVKDTSGGVVAGATVTITNTDTNSIRTAVTGDDGAFRVPQLLVGHYSVKVEKDGFKTQTLTALTLEVTQDLVVNSALEVGSSTQEVTVTGEVPVVNTTTSSLGGLVNEQKMADLPLNGRNWADLSLLQPGTEQHRNTGGSAPVTTSGVYYSSSGAPLRSNMYTLDGAIMLSIYGNAANSVNGSTLGVDGIQEFKITTNNFSAEYGLGMGSQVTIVSKGGTNKYHGAVFEYLRNSSLDARNFFDSPQSSGSNAAGQINRLPPFKRNNFGASIGGPLQKDKTFFFATFEGLRERKGLTDVNTTIPANCRTLTNNPCATLNPASSSVASTIPAGSVNPLIYPFISLTPPSGLPLFPLPTPGLGANQFSYPFTRPVDEYYGQLRLDHTFSAKDSAFARYTIDYANLAQPTISSANPNIFDHVHGSSVFITAAETHIFSPTLLNTARFSLSVQLPQDESMGPSYASLGGTCTGGGTACDFIPGWPQLGIGSISIGGSASFSASVNIHAHQNLFAYSDDIFKTTGKHAFKFGVLITHWSDRMAYINGQRGSLSYGSLAAFLNGDDYTSIAGIGPFNATNMLGILRDYTYGTVGAYIEDDIRLTPRLTLNTGLRYEVVAPNIAEVNGIQAGLRNNATDQFTTPGPVIRVPSYKNFSPRLGFAWDVKGDGKTSVRGGAALMYDVGNIFPVIVEGARGGGLIGNTQVGTTTITIAPTTQTQASTSTCKASPLTMPLVYPTCFPGGNTIVGNDYSVKQPTIATFSLVVERQLPFGVGLSVGYSGSIGWHLYDRPDENPCIPTAVVNGVPNWVPVGGPVSGNNPICPNGRVNQFWGSMDMASTIANSRYNALQVLSQKRLTKGLQFQANYTWARSIDTGNGYLPGDMTWAAQPSERRGPSSFDIQQNMAVSLLYSLPKMSAGGFEGGVLNGWRLGLILTAQTGPPFTPTLNKDRSLAGVKSTNFANASLAPGRSIASITSGVSTANTIDPCPTAGQTLGTPTLWYDPCAFTTGSIGQLGTAGRNILYGPGLVEPDFSLTKDTPLKVLGESGTVEFRAEIFNIINRANFGMPGSGGAYPVYTGALTTADVETPLATAGIITKTNTTSRQLQFALRIMF